MKMLKTKHFRRIVVFLAMIAPAVYLFGSLFSALTGAHGEQVFAEPVYVNQYVDVESFGDSDSYRLSCTSDNLTAWVNSVPSTVTYVAMNPVEYNGVTYNRYYRYADDIATAYFTLRVGTDGDRLTLATRSGIGSPWVLSPGITSPIVLDIIGNYSILYTGVGATLSVPIMVPSSEVPENSGAYSDYVFKNFFAKDNFLEQIGEDVLSENPHGFTPFASFWKYLDENMLHMGDMQLGLMGYGYVYYCCHVLLFDIAFILVTFFLDFIQKVNDKVVGGVD